jgi:hypothetical protein
MKLKTTGKGNTPERVQESLNHYLEAVLNIACVIARGGSLPNALDLSYPSQRGGYWYFEGDKIHLHGSANNFFAFVVERGENYVTLQFHYRYDKQGFSDTLATLMAIRFPENCELCV